MIEYDEGVWWIQGGELHLDIPKLLTRLNLEDTPENRDLAVEEAIAAIAKYMPDVPCIIRRNSESPVDLV